MKLVAGSSFSADAVAALPGPEELRERRLESWARFAGSELPSESDEIWRYSRIDDLELDRYQPPREPGPASLSVEDLPAPLRELIEALGPASAILVSRATGPADVLGAVPGLSVSPVATLEREAGPRLGEELGGPEADPFVALNGAFALAPWKVSVAAGAVIDEPVVVVHWLEGEGAAFFPRLEVELGEGSSARVVEVLAGTAGDMLVVPYTYLAVGRGAKLGFGQVQLLGRGAWQLGNQVSRVAAAGTLRSMTVALGGYYARARTDSVLEGNGGESELMAVYFGTGAQMHDLRTVQHHAAPHSRSDLLFKGAVADEAQSVYSGLIRVEKGARGTNAFQTNRNLVLSGGARAYSVPNLEIEDNDVRCSHASAVGPVDEGQLFYLESRGVPTQAAGRLIVLGFLDEVLLRSPVPGALAWLRRALAAKFAEASTAR
jgi:Fe-S cluster assembly protein SufD